MIITKSWVTDGEIYNTMLRNMFIYIKKKTTKNKQ